mgnify:CR=1 FL=1
MSDRVQTKEFKVTRWDGVVDIAPGDEVTDHPQASLYGVQHFYITKFCKAWEVLKRCAVASACRWRRLAAKLDCAHDTQLSAVSLTLLKR